MDIQAIGNKIKEIRKKENLKQIELAKILNVSKQTLSSIETGKRMADFTLLTDVCKYFDISLDYLVGLTTIENPVKLLEINNTLELTPEIREDVEKYIRFLKGEKGRK
jgi:transcriptional regulator with XRE-family HTH domain